MRLGGWAAGIVLVAVVGCSGSSGTNEPSFSDVTSAPDAIQTAAHAVVLVTMPGFSATASFISPDGLLLTNNHVLGVDVCPIEGCFAKLTWDFQRGVPLRQAVTVYVVPKAVDAGLDMAVLQVSMDPGGPNLSTPSYLTIDARDPSALQGMHVTVVGHPEGSVKKWSSGEVVDSNGSWITTSAFILPGSSGSPLLDDRGHVVGLMHRSPTGESLVTNDGLNVSSTGTASGAIIAAMARPLPASMVSANAPTSEASVVANQQIYLDAHMDSASVDGTQRKVLDALGAACDAALAVTDYATPDDLTAALAPCYDAESWIECRTEVSGSSWGVCPSDASAWQSRYKALFEYWRAFNGDLELDVMSFAVASLASSMAGGQSNGQATLQEALAEAMPALDFHVADHLAAFEVDSYEGASVIDFARNYASVPGYAVNGGNLVGTVLWLGNLGALSHDDVRGLLASIHADGTIDLGTKLFIETAEYYRGILP